MLFLNTPFLLPPGSEPAANFVLRFAGSYTRGDVGIRLRVLHSALLAVDEGEAGASDHTHLRISLHSTGGEGGLLEGESNSKHFD